MKNEVTRCGMTDLELIHAELKEIKQNLQAINSRLSEEGKAPRLDFIREQAKRAVIEMRERRKKRKQTLTGKDEE